MTTTKKKDRYRFSHTDHKKHKERVSYHHKAFPWCFVVKTLSNIARIARYKPFGPHTFCWRKTTDYPHRVYCRSEAEAYVPGATGEGHKPVRAMLRNPSIPCISCASWLQSPSSPIQAPNGTLTRPALWLKPLHSHFSLHNSSFSLPSLALFPWRLCVFA